MRLSSHPLPPSSFRADALRRIYESTPPTPPVDAETPSSLPSSRAERSGLATLSSLVSDLELRPVPLLTPRPPDARPLLGGRFALDRELDSGGTAVIWLARDMALGEPRAVKLLTEHAATST